ncbi:MAG: hypothetical protein RML56_05940 [Burkholderiales bacterium]|nr:hypothetical protein [Burkholderiales bacterium]
MVPAAPRRLDYLRCLCARISARAWRAALAFAHDLAAVGVAWCGAYWLRFNLEIPDDFRAAMWERLPWVVLLHGAVFGASGLYRGLWRFASLPDLQRDPGRGRHRGDFRARAPCASGE